MDILGIGPLELIFVLIIALIVLGPKDMVKAGRTIGKFLRQIVTSPTWHAVTRTSTELRNLPNKLIRDAGLEDDIKQIENATRSAVPPSLNQDLSKWQEDINSWTTPPSAAESPDEAEIVEEFPKDDIGTIGSELPEQVNTPNDEQTSQVQEESSLPEEDGGDIQEQAD
jgi:uncharacterized protein YjiS (DUF1127 family)